MSSFILQMAALWFYEDVRKFGTMEVLVPELVDSYFLTKKIGPEPTEADLKEPAFQAALKKSKKPIKSALLDQKLVAGLGNIYVDEVLYRAKVHPARLGQSLTAREAKANSQRNDCCACSGC